MTSFATPTNFGFVNAQTYKQSNGHQVINYYMIFAKKYSIVRMGELVETTHEELEAKVKGAKYVEVSFEIHNNDHLIIGKVIRA